MLQERPSAKLRNMKNEQQLTSRGLGGAHFRCAGVANGNSQRQEEQEQGVSQESIAKVESHIEFRHV